VHDDVKAFVELAARVFEFAEPIVEIGSLQVPGQEGYANLRTFFPGKAYIGCDVVAGPGVDQIENIHQLSFADESVGSLIVVETLEHVANPYLAVRELHRVLPAGGVMIASMPFNFPIHHMPDYTRFTPEGMVQLLSVFETTAVFSQGDAKQPFAVYGMALKGGNEARRLEFEAAATRLQNEWYTSEFRDPLLRFEPLDSIARCDRPDRPLGPLASGSRVEQHFACARDGLVRIDVKFTPAGAPSGGWLSLRLCAEDGAELAAVEMRAGYVWHERWVAFAFPAVEKSAGRRLSFCLECSEPQSTVAPLTGIAVEEIAGAQLIVDGQPEAGTLCFEAFCQRAPLQRDRVANQPGTGSPAREAVQNSTALAAARLQASELHYVATRLHDATQKLRDDMAARLDRIGEELVAAQLRHNAQAEQLLRMDIRQEHQATVLGRIEAEVNSVADFIRALRQHWLLRGLSRLAGRRATGENPDDGGGRYATGERGHSK
jgi:hypothetical protein